MSRAIDRQLTFANLHFTFFFLFSLGFASLHSPLSAYASLREASNEGTYWPQNQVLPMFAAPHSLDVIDLQHVSTDEALMFSTLEGIVNRQEPRIYLLRTGSDEGSFTWLNDMKIPYVFHMNAWEVLTKYIREIKGVILYDPHLLDSLNVAVTLAGLQDGLVVSPDLAAKLEAAPYHLRVLSDLRGKFKNALDAYTWEVQKLWPLVTHRMLIGIPSSTNVTISPENWKSFQTVQQVAQPVTNGSNRAVYNLDLSHYLIGSAIYLRFQDAYSQDGWGPSVYQVTAKADNRVFAHFTPCTSQEDQYVFDHGNSSCNTGTSDTHRFADGNSYFIYRLVPPKGTKQIIVSVDMQNEFLVSASNVQPALSSEQQIPIDMPLRDYAVANRAMVFWLRTADMQETTLFTQILSSVQPGTPYLGWFDNEVNGVTLTSKHAVEVFAADYFQNLTVFSGIHAQTGQPKNIPTLPLQNKIYVTFTVSDGDNLEYDEHRMRLLWDNTERGSVPLNWSIDPVLCDAAPFILRHYQQTATMNDLLIAAPSGNGYYYPSLWPASNLGIYLGQSEAYLQRARMNILFALDITSSLLPDVIQEYNRWMHLDGMFYYNDGGDNSTRTVIAAAGTAPLSSQVIISSQSAGLQEIHQLAATWEGKSPLFISVLLDAWHMTPTDAASISQALGANYSVVRADQYLQLFREAHGLHSED